MTISCAIILSQSSKVMIQLISNLVHSLTQNNRTIDTEDNAFLHATVHIQIAINRAVKGHIINRQIIVIKAQLFGKNLTHGDTVCIQPTIRRRKVSPASNSVNRALSNVIQSLPQSSSILSIILESNIVHVLYCIGHSLAQHSRVASIRIGVLAAGGTAVADAFATASQHADGHDAGQRQRSNLLEFHNEDPISYFSIFSLFSLVRVL